MDCKFKILTKDNNTFEILKTKADGFSKKGFIINAKCEFLDKFDMKRFEPIIWKRDDFDCIPF